MWSRTSALFFRPRRHHARPAPKPRRSPPPRIEPLEDRTAPAILFQPSPYHTIDFGGPVLRHVDVDLVFWGDAWAFNPRLANRFATAVASITSGPYLTDLAQYRGIGPGTFQRIDAIADNCLPAPFTVDDAIAAGVAPDPRTNP